MAVDPPAERPVSPRTVSEPMAFTGPEYFRGALCTLLGFTLLFPLATLLPGIGMALQGGSVPSFDSLFTYFPLAMGYAGLVAAAVGATIGGPLAYLLGRALRRRTRKTLHRCAFAALGLTLGAAGSLLFVLPFTSDGSTIPFELILQASVTAGICVWAGWEFTSSRALRHDVDPPAQRPDPDEAAEDAAVDAGSRRSAGAV